jgi:hypothetical protein
MSGYAVARYGLHDFEVQGRSSQVCIVKTVRDVAKGAVLADPTPEQSIEALSRAERIARALDLLDAHGED